MTLDVPETTKKAKNTFFVKEIPTFFVSISEIHILNESLFVVRAM